MTRTKIESEPLETQEKDSGNDDDDEEEEEEASHTGNAHEGSLAACVGDENVKPDQDEEQESKDNSG